MTKVVFETAALASALGEASRVAPTRGDSFTKAAGIVLDITADECIVMATDTLVRYSKWLTPEEFEGEPVSWRLPSRIFADLIGKLKSTTSKTLTLEQDGTQLKLTHGRTRATFSLMDVSGYPRWTPFSPDDMQEVTGLSKAVSSVVWATAKGGEPPMVGVHLDGVSALATDRYRFASAPCEIKLEDPITIPPAAITGVLKTNISVMMRVEGKQIYIMPDEFTQIALTAYGDDFPPVQRLMIREYPYSVKVSKQALLDTIELVQTMVGADRMPTLHLIFGRSQIAVMIANQEVGRVGHVMEVPNQLTFSERHEIRFNPDNFNGALQGCAGAEVLIGYDPEKPYAAVYVAGSEEIEFWLAPRQKIDAESD